jgi:hypothetical protein
MSVLRLTIIALACVVGPDPAALTRQLGSKLATEREAAATSLERMGPEALPALRAALDGQDPEIQGRSAALIRRIEGLRLIRPTPVTLDFQDRPMSEVIQEITARTGCRLRIYELQVEWLAQRITLREEVPLPFWKAVDRICEAGRFQYNLMSDAGGACVSFFREDISGPAFDNGVFRVQLDEIFYNGRYRKIHLGQDRASGPIFREDDRENSYITLRIMTEPRMMIRTDGAPRDLSVIDEFGRSLLPADPKFDPCFDIGYTPAAYVLRQVPLKASERPGGVIRKLSGTAPIAVAARRPDPLVIPLANAVGRSYRGAESIVTIRKVAKITPHSKITIEPVDPEETGGKPQTAPPEATGIELTIRPLDRLGPPDSMPNARRPAVPQDQVPDLSEDQFEVLDAAGKVWKPSPWWLSDTGPRRQGGEIRVRLSPVDGNLSPWPWTGDLTGATLRYYDMIAVKVEVPFQFADVPLP